MRLGATGALVLAMCGFGQPASRPTLSGQNALGQIASLSQQLRFDCAQGDKLVLFVSASWLSERFQSTGWSKVQPEYVASLGALAAELQKAAGSKNEKAACESIHLISQDLQDKHEDCRALGHSRTNIPVEIQTMAGGREVAGWEVYTRWLPSGDSFSGAPKRLQGLSSPARGTVPFPGEFEIYAKQTSSGISTEPVRVSIHETQVFKWPLPVPAK